MSVNSKMTAIADEIRTLSGTTDTMGLDAMATNLSEANGEVNRQVDLISQIQTALEGKATYNTIYIGSATPSSDLGVNGDIYIVKREG